jgi:hypothetical protein
MQQISLLHIHTHTHTYHVLSTALVLLYFSSIKRQSFNSVHCTEWMLWHLMHIMFSFNNT